MQPFLKLYYLVLHFSVDDNQYILSVFLFQDSLQLPSGTALCYFRFSSWYYYSLAAGFEWCCLLCCCNLGLADYVDYHKMNFCWNHFDCSTPYFSNVSYSPMAYCYNSKCRHYLNQQNLLQIWPFFVLAGNYPNMKSHLDISFSSWCQITFFGELASG